MQNIPLPPVNFYHLSILLNSKQRDTHRESEHVPHEFHLPLKTLDDTKCSRLV